MRERPQHKSVLAKGPAKGRQGNRRNDRGTAGEKDLSYGELVERVPAVLYVDASDEASPAVCINPQGETLLGYAREEWLEDPRLWIKTLHPEDRARVVGGHARARRAGEPFEAEYRLIARDGSVVWVRHEAQPAESGGGPGRRAGVLLDITDRKRYEERLKRSEERFRLVADVTGEAIWDNDLATGVQEWDGATESLFGYPPHEGRTGEWWEERIHPDDREGVLSGLGAVLDGAGEVWGAEYRFRRADGSYACVSDRARVVRDASGFPVRVVGAMRDVTEKWRHEEELRRSEERFRITFEAAAVGMAHLAPDGAWIEVNDELCRISGYARDELLRMSYLDLAVPGDLAAGDQRIRSLLEGESGPYSVERRFVRKGGSLVWVNLSVSLARKRSGEPDYLICVAEDITWRKAAELAFGSLTPREREVVALMLHDRPNAEVARSLSLSLPTVKTHVRNALNKLGVRNRRDLLRCYPPGRRGGAPLP